MTQSSLSNQHEPTSSIQQRAAGRFAGLREKTLNEFETIHWGAIPAGGWCLSTIARIAVNAPGIVPRIKELQEHLAAVGEVYQYDERSLHVSLLGCTQREPNPPDERRAQAVRRVACDILAGVGPVMVTVGRINMTGNQVFLEMIPEDGQWAAMRQRLGEALTGIGEAPMTHPDPEPMHLNVARLLSRPQEGALRRVLMDEDMTVHETILLSEVELVLTDFAVSPDKTTVLDLLRLS